MLIVAGIGNPGAKYQYNRHNIGFLVCGALADEFSQQQVASKYGNQYVDAHSGDCRFRLIFPQKYVNLSGLPVKKMLDFYQLPSQKLLVIHDDIDLSPGKIKIKIGGAAGGHNGLKDIDRHIGKDYWRLRIGVGRPGDPDAVASYVLNNVPLLEFETLFLPIFASIVANFPLLMVENEFNLPNSQSFLKAIAN